MHDTSLIHDSWYMIQDTSLIHDSGCFLDTWYMIHDARYMIHDAWYRIQDTWYKIQDCRYRIQPFNFRNGENPRFTESGHLTKICEGYRPCQLSAKRSGGCYHPPYGVADVATSHTKWRMQAPAIKSGGHWPQKTKFCPWYKYGIFYTIIRKCQGEKNASLYWTHCVLYLTPNGCNKRLTAGINALRAVLNA